MILRILLLFASVFYLLRGLACDAENNSVVTVLFKNNKNICHPVTASFNNIRTNNI